MTDYEKGRQAALVELRQWLVLNHDNRGFPIPWADMYSELRSEIIDKLRETLPNDSSPRNQETPDVNPAH